MEKLSMCRICLSDDIPLRSIIKTHLQDMYESLTETPFVAEDIRPVYHLWCARLDNSFELKEKCLQSEKLFAELLQVKVKQKNAEDTRDDRSTSSDSEDIIILLVVKEDPSDVTGNAPRLAAQKYRNDTLSNLKRTDQTLDKVEEPRRETGRDIEDKPVKKNKIVDTRNKIDMKLRNKKQNNSTPDHTSYVHKEMSEKEISSRNKLTPWSCDTCQKRFKWQCGLIRHIRSHTGEKPFECNVCKKCYNQKGYLNVHMRKHTREKPFECNVCKQCFMYKSSLEIHIRTHTDEKPYECFVCNKRFREKGNLNSHMSIHTGERPYKCNVCKKCFIRSDRLNVHMRIHTREKPYECIVCKKCFKLKSRLDIHIRTHTGGKP